MGLQTIKSDSTWGKASADINNNFDTLGSEITKVKNATTNNKGYFDTSEELIAMFPSGTSNQIAYVGKSHPYAIWKWDGTKWYDTKQTGGAESLDLNSYYPKKEVDEKFTETDAKLSELGSQVIYDVSANNDGATFASLSALLSSENLSTLIPTAVRCGGMSIRFVQSSDNKYVQYRYISDDATTVATFINTNNWSFCGDDVLIENPEFVEAKTDAEGKLLEARKTDGTKVENSNLEVKGEILNEKLQKQLNSLVNKEEGKSLIDADFASSQEAIENAEWLKLHMDANGKILEGIKKDGKKISYIESIELQQDVEVVQTTEVGYIDADGKAKNNGSYHYTKPIKLNVGDCVSSIVTGHGVAAISEYCDYNTYSIIKWIRNTNNKLLKFVANRDMSVAICTEGNTTAYIERCKKKKLIEHIKEHISSMGAKMEYLYPITIETTDSHLNADVKIAFTKNLCNYSGTQRILSLRNNLNEYYTVQIVHDKPSSELLPQRYGLEHPEFRPDIYMVDFPMANIQHRLQIKKSNTMLQDWPLNGRMFRSLLKKTPLFMVRLNCDRSDIPNMTNVKLNINESNGVVSDLVITDGSTVLYTYNFDTAKTLFTTYNEIKSGLEQISSYDFELIYNDFTTYKVEDIVCTKSEGLKFVTAISSTSQQTGNIVYDTYPVLVEAQDNAYYTLNIRLSQHGCCLYIDDALIYQSEMIGKSVEATIGYEGTKVISVSQSEEDTLDPNCIIKMVDCHALSNEPYDPSNEPAWDATPVTALLDFKQRAEKLGYVNISMMDLYRHLYDDYPLPRRCYIIELDDLLSLSSFGDWFKTEDGKRIVETLKMGGIAVNLVAEYFLDNALYTKIKNGTATEEEKATYSSRIDNYVAEGYRSMIKSYNWHIGIHTMVSAHDEQPTRMFFDEFVTAVRESVDWQKRVFDSVPLSFCWAGTGSVSPYFMRLFPMYGVPLLMDNYQSEMGVEEHYDYIPIYNTVSKFLSHCNRWYAGNMFKDTNMELKVYKKDKGYMQ